MEKSVFMNLTLGVGVCLRAMNSRSLGGRFWHMPLTIRTAPTLPMSLTLSLDLHCTVSISFTFLPLFFSQIFVVLLP